MTRLEAVSQAVARAVTRHEDAHVTSVADWPHEGTFDLLRPLVEHPVPGTFLIVHDGLVVGECGCVGPAVDGEVEIGFGLAPSARGRGIGAAAVAQLVQWAWAQGADTVRAEVKPGNEASLRLLAGLGFAVTEKRAGHLVLQLRSQLRSQLSAQRSANASFQTGS